MPAQSGEDPVSAALQLTLAPVKYRNKIGENSLPSTSSNDLGFDTRIMSSAAEILSANIQYTVGDESYSPASLYSKLKEKYTVLSANNQIAVSGGGGTARNSTETSSLTVASTSSTNSNATNSEVVSPETDGKKLQQQSVPQSSSSQPIVNKSTTAASLPTPKKVLYPPNLVCLGWKGSVPVGAGFVNLGNTCYLNSALQALLHVPAFVNWLQSDNIHISQCESMNGMTHSECLICAMVKILHNTHKYTGTAIKPSNIYSKLKDICKHLVHGHQEDAHEFLRYLIEGMERSYLTIFNGMRLDSYSKETTPLNQIFGGYMRTEVTCLECGYVSTTFQHFQDLLLDIRQANSIEEALDTYFSRERLGDGDQAYKCGQCKRRAAATKKFSIERPPNALCIQLKRFIVFRRVFLMVSVLYLMRSITMYVTVLPVSSTTYYCSPKANSTSFVIVAKRVFQLMSGFGLSINGKHTYCGDFIYSGHTVVLVMCYLIINEYSPKRLIMLHWGSLILSTLGILLVLLARGHYTVDVLIAYYVTTRTFWIYHTLANHKKLKQATADNTLSRIWWFKIFCYFEGNVGGPVPRLYNWPLPWPRRLLAKHPNRDS